MASVFTIDALPASYGDSLWIEYGEAGSTHHILVDGGVSSTFEHLEKRIRSLPQPRTLDLLVVTHVDEDHIAAAVKLMGAVRTLGLDIGQVWFNGRDHLEGRQVSPDKLGSKQGEFLAALIAKQGMKWNLASGWGPVEVPSSGPLPCHCLPGGMRLTILSPGREQLEAMVVPWDRELADARVKIDWTDIDAVLAFLEKTPALRPRDALGGSSKLDDLLGARFEPDTAPANGTSIAMLAEFAGRSVLLGADAYAPVLSSSIERLQKERGHAGKPLHVNLFKVPHHGSKANLSVDLLERLDCTNYLVSTDGKKFSHPDAEAMARIVRHGGSMPAIHFNYRSRFSALWDREDMGQDIDYHATYPDKDHDGHCRIDVLAIGTRTDSPPD